MVTLRAKITGLFRDVVNGGWELHLSSPYQTDLEGLFGRELSVELKEYKQKRSLTANAYYHLLLGQLARKMKVSNSYAHNMMLQRYGVPEIEEGDMIYAQLPDEIDVMDRMMERDDVHFMPTTKVLKGKNGKYYRFWRMLKGSSRMNSLEFSGLVDGLVSECKDCGIETLSPEEIERLQGYVKKHNA